MPLNDTDGDQSYLNDLARHRTASDRQSAQPKVAIYFATC